jgi:hypothetical protein
MRTLLATAMPASWTKAVKIICIPPNGSLLSICRRACADLCASGREWHALGQPERTASALTRAVLVANLVLCPLLPAHRRGVRVRQGHAGDGVVLALVAIGATHAVSRLVERRPERAALPNWRVALRGGARTVYRDPIAVALIAYVISAVASTVTSISPRTSLFGANENSAGLVPILAYAVIFFVTRAALSAAAQVERLLLVSVVPASVTEVYALLQIAGVDPIQWTRVSEAGTLVRPLATLGHPNLLAA